MYLGIYEIDGDPTELLAAYDRLISMMPESQVVFHACAIRENGITVFDACATRKRSSGSGVWAGQPVSRRCPGLLTTGLPRQVGSPACGIRSSPPWPWPLSRQRLLGIGLATPHTNYGTAGWVGSWSAKPSWRLSPGSSAGGREPAVAVPAAAPAAAPPSRRANLVTSQGTPAFVAGDDEVVFNYRIENASDHMAWRVGLSFGKRDGTPLGKPAGGDAQPGRPRPHDDHHSPFAIRLHGRSPLNHRAGQTSTLASMSKTDRSGDLPPRRPT